MLVLQMLLCVQMKSFDNLQLAYRSVKEFPIPFHVSQGRLDVLV